MDDGFPSLNVGPNFHQNFFRANQMDDGSDNSEQEDEQNNRNFMMIRRSDGDGYSNIIIFGNDPSASGFNIGRNGLNFNSIDRFDQLFRHLLQNMGVRNHSQQRPASQETIENLKEIDITEDMYEENEKGEKVAPTCAICTDEMKDKAIELKCQHLYHRACIVKWIQIHNVCPVCRVPPGGNR